MGTIQNKVYYCCVSKGSRILYVFRGGEPEIENLAALCLEKKPPYHQWYFQTMNKKTFGFFMEGEYVYFAIVDEGLGNRGLLRLLKHASDEFKKVAKRGSSRSISNLHSLYLQEQIVPVICRLITSLEHVSESATEWPAEAPPQHCSGLSPSTCSNANGETEVGASTKAPLLSKSTKQEKKKMKDHAIPIGDIELEGHRNSTDRGAMIDSGNLHHNDQGAAISPISLRRDLDSMRLRSSTQNIRKKWCHLVRIVLAIDAVVCLALFVIWLVVCGGIECIH